MMTMDDTCVANLTKLRDYMLTLEPGRLQWYPFVKSLLPDGSVDCGCVIGHCVNIFPAHFKVTYFIDGVLTLLPRKNHCVDSALSILLGLSRDTIFELFYPPSDRVDTPSIVADKLTALLTK